MLCVRLPFSNTWSYVLGGLVCLRGGCALNRIEIFAFVAPLKDRPEADQEQCENYQPGQNELK